MKHISPQQLARMAAMILAAATAVTAIVHSGTNNIGGVVAPFEREQADALVSELARCRTITSPEATALESCRRIWADNRRQFFAPVKSRQPPAELPTIPSAPLKIQDRLVPTLIDPQQSETR